MFRSTLVDDRICGADGGNGLEELLQPALGVVVGRVDFEVFEKFASLGEDDPADRDEIAIEIHGSNQGLEGIGQRAGPVPTAVGFFAAAHHEIAAEGEPVGQDAQAVARNDAGADFCEVALAELREQIEEIFGEDELENGVAEKFKPLIVEVMALRLVTETGMGERFREEERVAEFVFKALFERVHEGRREMIVQTICPLANAKSRPESGADDGGGAPKEGRRPSLRMARVSSRLTKMPEVTTPPANSAWPKAVTIIATMALLTGGALLGLRMMRDFPGAAMDRGTEMLKTLGGEAAKVARAFNENTVREEFISHAAELTGTSRFQFATLRESEVFQRAETGSTAWGLIPLPTVVVEARAPVEYSYFLDFAGDWEFARVDSQLTVFAPLIAANAPALEISALQFYTLEGSIWRNDDAVRDRLKDTLSVALKERAARNVALVREIGRQRLAEFVEKWLAEKFSDGKALRVKVVFPDERPPSAARQTAL